MALVSFDTLLKYCLPELPGAPEPLVADALLTAARILCSDASVWHTTQAVTIVEGQPDYVLTKPSAESSAWFIKSVLCDRIPIPPADEHEAATLSGTVGQITRHQFLEPESIDFIVMPAASEVSRATSVTVVWIPSLDATTFPSELLDRYRDCLVASAKGIVMRIPGQAWTNAALGMQYEMGASVMRNKARLDVMHGKVARSFEIARRPFGF